MNKINKCWAIIPAAGIGSRFASDIPKQYLRVAGNSILAHSIERVLSAPQISLAIVCLAQDDQYWHQDPVSNSSQVKATIGGETRAHSVLKGLEFLAKFASDNDWVLVHDAARPLLDRFSLQQLISHCESSQRGAILASASVNTLKEVSDDNSICSTLDRLKIWQAETPQMFRLGQLTDALSAALAGNADITDESSAMELAGHHVDVVASESNNLKVTTQADIGLLEFLMQDKQSSISD